MPSSRSRSPLHRSSMERRHARSRSRSNSPRRSYSRSRSRSRSYSPQRRRSPFPDRRRQGRQRSFSRSRSPPPSSRHHRQRSFSRSSPRHRRRSISRSPPPQPRGPPRRRQRSPGADRRRGPREGRRQQYEWGRPEDHEASQNAKEDEEDIVKEEPNFNLSGRLAAETNTINGVELKYNEPPEAAKPKIHWRLYVFKGDKQLEVLYLHRKSSFLVGRDRIVADIPTDHPSCSKQHAVIQFRRVTETDDITGEQHEVVKPYVIDLESTNGTFVNGEKVAETRFMELRFKDVIRFGDSTREYVLLHADTQGEE